MEDERLRFVARLLDGESMTALCAEFGISRKTGYKIYDRYKEVGLQGLTDRSRRPYRHANQLPMAIEKTEVHRVYRRAVSVSEVVPFNGRRKWCRRSAAVARNIDVGARMPPSAPA